eukprot:scaffold38933_cov78-Phaeocystis_antarctica.AAC.1
MGHHSASIACKKLQRANQWPSWMGSRAATAAPATAAPALPSRCAVAVRWRPLHGHSLSDDRAASGAYSHRYAASDASCSCCAAVSVGAPWSALRLHSGGAPAARHGVSSGGALGCWARTCSRSACGLKSGWGLRPLTATHETA